MNDQTQETPDPIDVVLTLDQERPKVSLAGKLYSLAIMDDFGIREEHQIKADCEEFDKLWGSPKRLTDTRNARMEGLLYSLFERVRHEVPAEIRDPNDPNAEPIALGDARKAQVVLAFWSGPVLIEARRKALRAKEEETE